MNSRQKFLSVMRMNCSDYNNVAIPKVEFGYWAGTIRNWFSEGLTKKAEIPEKINDGSQIMGCKNIYLEMEDLGDVNVSSYCNLDSNLSKFPANYSPMFKKTIIKKDEKYIVFKDEYGVIKKSVVGLKTIPMDIDNPVKGWDSWKKYKKHYTSDTIPLRLPPNWDKLKVELKKRDFPIRVGAMPAGFFGFPRHIMGLTRFLLGLYDQPDLIQDICNTFLEFLLEYYSRIMSDIDIDCILLWEDMSGKQGSLISPEQFKKFLAPCYKTLIDFVKSKGIDIILVDTDGYVEELIPLMIETGVTGMYPFERACENNLLRIRKKYPNFQMLGGIDKRVLFKDSNLRKIQDELKLIRTLLETGRYIPHIDHFVSVDCTWPNFLYYRNNLNSLIDDLKNN